MTNSSLIAFRQCIGTSWQPFLEPTNIKLHGLGPFKPKVKPDKLKAKCFPPQSLTHRVFPANLFLSPRPRPQGFPHLPICPISPSPYLHRRFLCLRNTDSYVFCSHDREHRPDCRATFQPPSTRQTTANMECLLSLPDEDAPSGDTQPLHDHLMLMGPAGLSETAHRRRLTNTEAEWLAREG